MGISIKRVCIIYVVALVIYGIISEFTDKEKFHYLTKLKGPQVGNYLYTFAEIRINILS